MLVQQFNPYIRVVQGAILSIGAPLGWLLIQMFQGVAPITELKANIGLYTYMLLGTISAFSSFGWYVGRKEYLATVLALQDALTGLYNVRYFRERLVQEIMIAKRENTSLVLISFDVDHFKMVNDNHGHQLGDEVLIAICVAANKVVRKYEVLARVGGEEFVLLLPHCRLETGTEIAERIRAEIAATFVITKTSEKISVTVSLGLTKLEPDDDEKEFLERADAVLYLAKESGRDQVIVG